MKFREPTKLHRKSGMWGTRRLLPDKAGDWSADIVGR
jgi:hypothetical protein